MEPIFAQVLDALLPHSEGFFERLKEEAARKAKGEKETGGDALCEALVLDLAGNVLANKLDKEQSDEGIEQLQLLIATVHKEKDRAIGKIRNMSRLDYSDLKTGILSQIIHELLPSPFPLAQDEDSMEELPPSITSSRSYQQAVEIERRNSRDTSQNTARNHQPPHPRSRSTSLDEYAITASSRDRRASRMEILRDDEVFRYAEDENGQGSEEDERSSMYEPSRSQRSRVGLSRPPINPAVGRERDVNASQISGESRKPNSGSVIRGSASPGILNDRIRRMEEENQLLQRGQGSAPLAFGADRRGSVVSRTTSPYQGMQRRRSLDETPLRPLMVVPTAAVAAEAISRSRTPQAMTRARAHPPPPVQPPITSQPSFYDQERNRLLSELRRTRDEYNEMRVNEERIAVDIAMKVEEMQSRIVEVQRAAQEATAAKDDEILRIRQVHEQEKAHLMAELEEARKITSESLEAEIESLKERFETERKEWDQLRAETENIVRDTRTSLEARFEREKEMAVRAATEVAAEMAADETRIQMEEFQSRFAEERQRFEADKQMITEECEQRLRERLELELSNQRSLLDAEHRASLEQLREGSSRAIESIRSQQQNDRAMLEAHFIQERESLETAHQAEKTRLITEKDSELTKVRDELEQLKVVLSSQQATISSLREEKENLSGETTSEVKRLQEVISSMEQQLATSRETFEKEKETMRTEMELEFISTIDNEKQQLIESLNGGWTLKLQQELERVNTEWQLKLNAVTEQTELQLQSQRKESEEFAVTLKQQLEDARQELEETKTTLALKDEQILHAHTEMNKLTEDRYTELNQVHVGWQSRYDELIRIHQAELSRTTAEWTSRVEMAKSESQEVGRDIETRIRGEMLSRLDEEQKKHQLEITETIQTWSKRLEEQRTQLEAEMVKMKQHDLAQFQLELAKARDDLTKRSSVETTQLTNEIASLKEESRRLVEQERAAWSAKLHQQVTEHEQVLDELKSGVEEKVQEERRRAEMQSTEAVERAISIAKTEWEHQMNEAFKLAEAAHREEMQQLQSRYEDELNRLRSEHQGVGDEQIAHIEAEKVQLNTEWQTFWEQEQARFNTERESLVAECNRLRASLMEFESTGKEKNSGLEQEFQARLHEEHKRHETELATVKQQDEELLFALEQELFAEKQKVRQQEELERIHKQQSQEMETRFEQQMQELRLKYSGELDALKKTLQDQSRDSVEATSNVQSLIQAERLRWQTENNEKLQQSLEEAAENGASLAADVAKLERDELEERYQQELAKVILERDAAVRRSAQEREEMEARHKQELEMLSSSIKSSSASSFEMTKMTAELRIAQEKARLAQEKLDLETRRIRNEYEGKLREQRRNSVSSVTSLDDEGSKSMLQEVAIQQLLQKQREQFEAEMQGALSKQNEEWESFMREENARIEKRIEQAVNASREMANDEVEMLKAEHAEELNRVLHQQHQQQSTTVVTGEDVVSPAAASSTISQEEHDQIVKVAASLRRTMDTIIATLQDANRISRATSNCLDVLPPSTPDQKLNEMLRAAMQERAVFAKGILMSSKLAQLLPSLPDDRDIVLEDVSSGRALQHTPFGDRKSYLDSSFASAGISSSSVGSFRAKENASTEAEELEALMMSEVEL